MRSLKFTALILLGFALHAFAAQQVIVNKPINSGLGDPAPVAFDKVNANFTDLYTFLYAPITGAINIAPGTNTATFGTAAVPSTALALMPPQTILCNPSATTALSPVFCTATQINSFISGSGGSGGSGGISSISLSLPSLFTIDQPVLTANGGWNVTFTGGLAQSLFLATPTSSTGAASMRKIAQSDLPNLSGDVSSVAGVTNITSGAVVLSDMAPATAQSILCNPNSTASTPQYCSISTINTLIGNTGGGAPVQTGSTSSDPNRYQLCSTQGVDPTGVTDSYAAVVTAINNVAGSNKTLYVNCPIFLHYGQDYTKPIFIPSKTNLTMGPNGVFITDNVTVNAFFFVNSSDSTWTDVNIKYIGAFGVQSISQQYGPMTTVPGNVHNITLTNYLKNQLGYTFQGSATAAWSGPSAYITMFNFRGASQRNIFRNLHVYVPDGAPASNFVPIVCGFFPEYVYSGSALPSAAPTGSNSTTPTDIWFDSPIFDGFDMGFVNSGIVRITNPTFKRYSDMQDDTNGTVVFASGGLVSGATSGTLAANWPNQTGTYYGTFSNGQSFFFNLTNGSKVANKFTTALSSTPSSMTVTTGNVGGVANWFAPPHAIYMTAIDTAPYRLTVEGGFDQGPYVGLPTRRATTSGTTISVKFECNQGSSVRNYTSLRAEGLIDCMSLGNGGAATIENVTGVFDTSINTADGAPTWGFRWPSSIAYQNVTLHNMTLVDLNPSPQAMPMHPAAANGSYGVSMTGIKMFLLDWASSGHPSFTFSGDHIKIEMEIHFAQYSSDTTYRGLWAQSTTNTYNTNSDIEQTVFGFRAFPVVFSGSQLTSSTSNPTLKSSWGHSTGYYTVIFADDEVLQLKLTSGSTSVGGWGNGLNGTTSTSASATNSVVNNFAAYRARIAPAGAGSTSYNYHYHLNDVSNGYVADLTNGLVTETMIQGWSGTPPAGGTYTTPINLPSTMSIDRAVWSVDTAITGASSVNVGIGGGSQLLQGMQVSAGAPTLPLNTPVLSTGAITLAPQGANFGGGGQANVSVRGVDVYSAN